MGCASSDDRKGAVKQPPTLADGIQRSSDQIGKQYKSFKVVTSRKGHQTTIATDEFNNQTVILERYGYDQKDRAKAEWQIAMFNILKAKATDHIPNTLAVNLTTPKDKKEDIFVYVAMQQLDQWHTVKEIYNSNQQHFMNNERSVALLAAQVLDALKYLEQQKIMHLNIKIDNVMCNQWEDFDHDEAKYKLIGFSEASMMAAGIKGFEPNSSSLEYMSPQVVNKQPFTTKADVWSLGALCYLLLCGKPAFPCGVIKSEFDKRVAAGEIPFEEPVWKTISKEAKDFIKECMTVEEAKRQEPEKLLKNEWITKNQEKKEQVMDLSSQVKSYFTQEMRQHYEECKNYTAMQWAFLRYMNSQGFFEDQMEEMKTQFTAIDIGDDQEGQLSYEEIQNVFIESEMFNTEGGDEQLAELVNGIFQLFDTDGDNFISFDEFILLAAKKEEVFTEENYQKVFDQFDPEQQGFIALACLKSIFRQFNQSEEDEDVQFQEMMPQVGIESEDDGIHFDNFRAIVIKLFLINTFNEYVADDEEHHEEEGENEEEEQQEYHEEPEQEDGEEHQYEDEGSQHLEENEEQQEEYQEEPQYEEEEGQEEYQQEGEEEEQQPEEYQQDQQEAY